MTAPIKETDIFSVLPGFYAGETSPALETTIPTGEDPDLLIATLKTQAHLLHLFEAHGQMDRTGKQLEAELKNAIVELEQFLGEA